MGQKTVVDYLGLHNAKPQKTCRRSVEEFVLEAIGRSRISQQCKPEKGFIEGIFRKTLPLCFFDMINTNRFKIEAEIN